jgi:hypothetical protein
MLAYLSELQVLRITQSRTLAFGILGPPVGKTPTASLRSTGIDKQRFKIMIIYDLTCAEGHRFEGWFASANDFARQSEAEMVRCPLCNDVEVAIVPSARVQVGRYDPDRGDPDLAAATLPKPIAETAEMVGGLPPELVRKLREAVRATENVGRRFAEEARKIHYAETPPRAIRGQASASEAESLHDEGIEFAALPAFLTRESH